MYIQAFVSCICLLILYNIGCNSTSACGANHLSKAVGRSTHKQNPGHLDQKSSDPVM